MQVDATAEQGFKGEGILSGDPGCRGFYDHFKDTIDVTMYYWLLYQYLLRVTMRKLQLRGEEVLRVNLGLDEFCNNTTQRNEITLLMTFIFTLEGAQQLQARARRPR